MVMKIFKVVLLIAVLAGCQSMPPAEGGYNTRDNVVACTVISFLLVAISVAFNQGSTQ